ncbi:MAG: hypothetical protein OXU20_02325 [Myxococcales bacterium]|nr:hypothetical protein [Myxococcales bacterium]MDD9968004.1 hypothetical protein [Myxococcales bacterium]
MHGIDLEPYIRFEAAHVSSTLRRLLPQEQIVDNLRADLDHELTLRTSAARAAQYRTQCPIDGTTHRDYMLREFDLGSDGRVLAGIHFAGMDPRRPFVGVLARTEPLADVDAVRRVGRHLCDAFASFEPQWFRLWDHAADRGLSSIAGVCVDMLLVAGRLVELRALPVPETSASLALRPCRATDIYPAYCAIFERFFAAQPSWRGRIHVESEEALRQAETDGALRRAFVGGEPAGFFAVVPARERALRGYVMLEEILDTPFRGCGLAPALQRMLLDHIDADRDALLFGHIDGANLPSLHTARRVGRKEVCRTVFVPFGESSPQSPRGAFW